MDPVQQPTTQPASSEPVKPEVTAPVEKVSQSQEPQNQQLASKEPDVNEILKRIPVEAKETAQQALEEPFFNSTDIEKIQDPVLRESMTNIYKNMEKGLQKKFNKVAELTKKLETQAQPAKDSWTPERIQQLTQDPEFIQAAQQLAGTSEAGQHGFSDDEWSALSDTEKARITGMESKLSRIEKLLSDKDKQSQVLEVSRADEELRSRFPDYNPERVNEFAKDVDSGKYTTSQLRELMHKALNFEHYLSQAYKFGEEDRKQELQQKMGAVSMDGQSISQSEGLPTREEGESTRDFFKRLAGFRLKEAKTKSQQRF